MTRLSKKYTKSFDCVLEISVQKSKGGGRAKSAPFSVVFSLTLRGCRNFVGQKDQDIAPWLTQLEDALRAANRAITDAQLEESTCTLIPHRLSNAAYRVYTTLPQETERRL